MIISDLNYLETVDQATGKLKGVQFSKRAEDLGRKVAGETGAKVAVDAGNLASKALGALTYLHDIVDSAKAKLPSAEKWYKATMDIQAARNRMNQEAERIVKMFTETGIRTTGGTEIDADVIVIDPEREYEFLAEATGGRYFTNAVDTETRGVDFNTRYVHQIGRAHV